MAHSKLSQYIAAGEDISFQKFAPVLAGPSDSKRRRKLYDEMPDENYKQLFEYCQKRLMECLSKNEPDVLGSDSKIDDLLRELSYVPEKAADFLNENGYIVIKIPWMDEKRLPKMRKEFDNELKNFREFTPDAQDYILGGFSALGNPSSFHNMFARTLRKYAMAEVFYLFKAMIAKMPGNEWKLEQTIDRMLYRLPGKSTSAEAFHRDEAVFALPEDKVFGGWINLNSFPQYFSCVPRTHTEVKGHSGFNKIKDKGAIAKYKKEKKSIEIPAGHIMIFYENMVHEVLSKRTTETMYRLFTGWRITKSTECLLGVVDGETEKNKIKVKEGNKGLLKRLKDNAYIPLKSGQRPPMYSKLHWSNHAENILKPFSETNVKDKFKEVRFMKSSEKNYFVVQRFMKSLKDSKERLYPPYTEEEINMYIPNKTLSLPHGKDNKYYEFTLYDTK